MLSMKNKLLRTIAALSVLLASSASQAALTVYTTESSFLVVVSQVGTDTFDNFSNTSLTLSPVNRTAGTYGYTASASTSANPGFYGAGTTSDHWLSTNTATDSILFNDFTGNVSAIGGLFFGSDIFGAYLAGKSITIVVDDDNGSPITQTISLSTTSSFLGFVSDGLITSLSVSAVQDGIVWPTVNNLTLATVSAVPEPETYAMMLAGLGVIGAIARRRKVKQTA